MTDTSAAARTSMRTQAQTDRARVLAMFRRCGPMTPDECAARCGWADNPYRARRRCSELKADGQLEETGTTRKTKSGRAADVLCIPEPRRQLEMFG